MLSHAFRLGAAVTSRVRNLWFKMLGVDLRGYAWLRRVSMPRQWSDVAIEGRVGLDDGVVLLCSGPHRSEKILIRGGTYQPLHDPGCSRTHRDWPELHDWTALLYHGR
jgi:hypothetical protein